MKPLRIFVSYSHRDRAFCSDLVAHLSSLERSGVIETWHDGLIAPGSEWEREIADQLEHADIVLFLLSAHFFESQFCYDKELDVALRRHDQGSATVVPIVVRPVAWQHTALGRLQALPKDARPVELWPNQDAAWTQVCQSLVALTSDVRAQLERAHPSLSNGLEPVREALAFFVDIACASAPEGSSDFRRLLTEDDGGEHDIDGRLIAGLRAVDQVLADRVKGCHRIMHSRQVINAPSAREAVGRVLGANLMIEVMMGLTAARFTLQNEYELKYWMAVVEVLESLEGASALAHAVFKAYNKHIPTSLADARAALNKAANAYSSGAAAVAGTCERVKLTMG